MAENDLGGVWRTIGGRRVFIKDGQDLATAMRESGKFGNIKEKEEDNSDNKEFHKLENGKMTVSASEQEEIADYYINAWEKRIEKGDYFVKSRFGEKYENLLKQKEEGFKDKNYDLNRIEDCKELLDNLNWQIYDNDGKFERLDKDLRAEAVQQIYDITRNSPAIMENTEVNYFFLQADRYGNDTIAETQYGKVTLNVNDYYNKKHLEDIYNEGISNNWFVGVGKGNETKEFITHEMGHVQHQQTCDYLKKYFQIEINNDETSWNKEALNRMPESIKNVKEIKEAISKPDDYSGNNKRIKKSFTEEPIRRVMKNEGLSRKEVIDKYVSDYGKRDSDEMFAEMFANGLLGKPNSLGKETINYLKDIGGYRK